MFDRSGARGMHPIALIPKTGLILLLLACGSFLIPTLRSLRSDDPDQPLASQESIESSNTTTPADDPTSPSEPNASPSDPNAQSKPEVDPQSTAASQASGDLPSESTATKLDQDTVSNQSVGPSAIPAENPALVDSPASGDQLTELLSIVNDNTLTIHRREMPAYWHLIRDSQNEEYATLREQARKNPAFSEFYTAASKHRGELVSMDLNVRRIVEYDAIDQNNIAGVKKLYEVWGWTEQSKSWLYVCVTPELPAGLKPGPAVNYRAEFTGYFFKLLAYHSAKPTASGKPLVAPMMIGRFGVLKPPSLARKSADPLQMIVFVVFAVVCVAGLFIRWFLLRPTRRTPVPKAVADPVRDESTRFDWLDKVQSTPIRPEMADKAP